MNNNPIYPSDAPGVRPPETPNDIDQEDIKVSNDNQGSGWRSTLSTLLVVLAAPAIAIILVLFVFQSYQVDGPSMEPTLQNSDRLIVWKLPRTWSRVTGHAYIPTRGDVIVFQESTLNNKQLIKRVIGVPGDHVVIKDNVVTVSNKASPNGFNPDTTLPYGKKTPIAPTAGNVDLTVPGGQIFVCGDNRPDSLDSRYFGTVGSKDVVGKLVLRIVPLSKAQVF